jgi:hypothetical protein
MPDLIAGARDPVLKGQLVYSAVDPSLFRPAFAGEVAFASTLPVLLLAGDPGAGNALVVGMEGAVFARFSFAVVQRELVNTDWIFAVPLVWHRGDHWLRLRYYHTSSHLGDEYAQRFEQAATPFSRDGGDLTAFVRPSHQLGVYGLVFLSANSHPVGSKGSHLRAGIELNAAERRPGSFFAAADLRLDRSADWTPRLAAQAGLWLPPARGRPLRLALDLFAGPSAMGQFHGTHATHLGLGLYWSP